MAVPLSDLEFYKLNYRGEFTSLYLASSPRIFGELGYGDGYGEASELPFYGTFLPAALVLCAGTKSTLWGHALPHLLFTVLILLLQLLMRMAYLRSMEEMMVADLATASTLSRQIPVQEFYNRPNPFGGNVLIEGSAEILFQCRSLDRSSLDRRCS